MTKELNGETEMIDDDPDAFVPAIPGTLRPVAAV
jgi:hypothetical protein